MRIIIAGMGDVGYHLAKQLSQESHDIIAIDTSQQRLSYTDSMTDVMTVNGSSTSIKVLLDAKVDKADLLVAVTSSEEVNIATAILGKKLGAKKTIARIGNAEYQDPKVGVNFSEIGIDFMIYPEELAAIETVNLIQRTAATDILEFEKGKLTVMGLRLDKIAPIMHKKIFEVAQEYQSVDFRIVAIYRNFRTIIPSGNDRFLPNDQVFVITTQSGIETVLKLAGKENIKFENIMVLGGGKIGRRVAKLLEKSMKVKLIESDEEKSFELADMLQDTLVIRGDGRDIDLLAQEGIVDMDAFIALTEDAETNIITCLMAKHLGVKKAIALVDKVDYIPLTQTIGLDSLINKKLIAANSISRFIRRGEVLAIASLEGIDAEVLEYVATSDSPATKKKVKDLHFPNDAIIGGVIRGEESFIVVGNSQIKPNDKVVVFSLPGAARKTEKFF
ncbi:MAG: Trk system potassium transport protein TrkA [Ignavibacteria bacterium GWA2_35_9]|nr:MAG: Trk system potassium transport protein TrkA [Ignavibacteria bacterium GWA2_35_9]